MLKVFLATHTFEYEVFRENQDLATSTYRELHPAADLSFAGSLEQKAVQFAAKIQASRDKALFAQLLAHKIEQDSSIPLVVPTYIRDAVAWVTRGRQEEARVSATN